MRHSVSELFLYRVENYYYCKNYDCPFFLNFDNPALCMCSGFGGMSCKLQWLHK